MRFSELDGRRIAVWGAGLETRSFARKVNARLPRAELVALIVEDGVDPASLHEPELLGHGAAVVAASTAPQLAGEVDVIVRSPGVSIHRPELVALAAAGVPAATATGLWLAERGGRNVIGVTATKGKSTTASLIAHLARAAGEVAHLAGNIGEPALDLLGIGDDELVVLELSSYQIADLTIGPQTALAANLYREHLDWHGSEQAYRAEKLRLLALPGVERCVVGALSAEVMAAPLREGAVRTTFGVAPGWHVRPDGVAFGDALIVPTPKLPLPGAHNALNLCGALAALDAHRVPLPPLPDGLAGFAALPHRLEQVHVDGHGVLWIDDSISTTTESAIVALDSFPGVDVILLGGGLDRGQDYGPLGAKLAERGAAVIAMPQTGDRLLAAAHAAGLPPGRARAAADLPHAVQAARELARPGSVILLSPAAPSYHAYKDFKERGEHFRALARIG